MLVLSHNQLKSKLCYHEVCVFVCVGGGGGGRGKYPMESEGWMYITNKNKNKCPCCCNCNMVKPLSKLSWGDVGGGGEEKKTCGIRCILLLPIKKMDWDTTWNEKAGLQQQKVHISEAATKLNQPSQEGGGGCWGGAPLSKNATWWWRWRGGGGTVNSRKAGCVLNVQVAEAVMGAQWTVGRQDACWTFRLQKLWQARTTAWERH